MVEKNLGLKHHIEALYAERESLLKELAMVNHKYRERYEEIQKELLDLEAKEYK